VSVAGRRRRCYYSYAWLVLSIGAATGVAAAGAYRSYYATAPALARRAPRATVSVVGGAAAPISRFPFQVALYYPELGRLTAGFFCGGVIVDATHVITAAHCLAGIGHSPARLSREVAVLAGSTSLDRPDPGSVRDPAASVSMDPHYNPTTNDYDIGIVTLARPLWTGTIAPSIGGAGTIAPLPIDRAAAESYGEPNGTPSVIATVSGWGDTSPAPGAASYPTILRSVRVPLVPEESCQEAYASIELTITPRMICAGSSRPRADSCFGDSGGPLVVDRDNPARPPGDYVLVGLVDFGDGCALPGFAGVYTRIADPAIAHYLATGTGGRAQAAGHRGRKKKRRHH
jgi:secreted trypsin-like serine protease